MADRDASSEDFAQLLAAEEAGAAARPQVGDVVSGRVIALGQTTAFVAVGGKGEAMIDLAEFRDPQTGELGLAVGDTVEATVIDDGARSGSILLRRTAGRGGHVSAEIEQAHAHGIPVEGVVTAENKGGYEVQIGSVRAFCPGSQIDRRRGDGGAAARQAAGEGAQSPSQYVGQRLQFLVVRVEAGGRNVVVSRRQLLERDAAALAAETLARLEVGATVSGTVSSLRDFGAFVDLGGVEGLIHISELGHGRVAHPSDVLEVGQQVEAQVLKIDRPAGPGGRVQIGLSLRALAPDPWSTASERFPAGTTVRGTVRKLESFGAFVTLAPGLDGLLHVGKMALDRRIAHPRQVLSVGQGVEVTVLAVDPAQRRISLSMIERAREERDAEQVRERAEAEALVARTNERRSFGTLGDLLARSAAKRPPRG